MNSIYCSTFRPIWSLDFFQVPLFRPGPGSIWPHSAVLTSVTPVSINFINATGLQWVGELAEFYFTIRYRPSKGNADADTLSRTSKGMDNFMKLCTVETTQNELRTIIQTVRLQAEGNVNWVPSLTNDLSILSVEVLRPSVSNRPTLKATDIRQTQIEDSVIGKVYLFI